MRAGSSAINQTKTSLGLVLPSDDSEEDIPLMKKAQIVTGQSSVLVESPKEVSMEYSPIVEALDIGNVGGDFVEHSMEITSKGDEPETKGETFEIAQMQGQTSGSIPLGIQIPTSELHHPTPTVAQGPNKHENSSMDVDNVVPLPNPIEFIQTALQDSMIS
jgi:hypothetical protein